MRRTVLLVGFVCLIASRSASAAPVLLGTFSGQFGGGFTSNVPSPTGFRINFSAVTCFYPYAQCGNPSYPNNDPSTALFGSVGLILPSGAPQVFTANANTPGFALIASVLTGATVASVSQLFYCNEATTITNCVPYASAAQARPPAAFQFPNATLTSIQVTLSPWSWVQNSNGNWWRRQSDGSLASVTVSAYGVPGFGPIPTAPPSQVPEPSTFFLISGAIAILAGRPTKSSGCLDDVQRIRSRRPKGDIPPIPRFRYTIGAFTCRRSFSQGPPLFAILWL